MSVIKRVIQLCSADAHQVLDKLEDAEALLKQSIREMEQVICVNEAHKSRLCDQKSKVTRSQQELLDRLRELQQQIELCFQEEKEQLAKSQIKRRLETEQSIAEHVKTQQELDLEQSRIEKELAEQKPRLDDIRDKLRLIEAKKSTQVAVSDKYVRPSSDVNADDIEIAYLKARKDWENKKRGANV